MDSYDKIVAQIAFCHEHGDVCCLAHEPTFRKVARWLATYGEQRTFDLVKLACSCQVTLPPPPPGQPTLGPPVTPPPPPTVINPPPTEPPPPPPPPTPPGTVLSCNQLPPPRQPRGT